MSAILGEVLWMAHRHPFSFGRLLAVGTELVAERNVTAWLRRYLPGDEPAENAFDLKDLELPKPESRQRSRARPAPGSTDAPESRPVRPEDLRDLFAPGSAPESLPRPAGDD